MNEVEDRDEWRPFCGHMFPLDQTAGNPLICTIEPHDEATSKHLNEQTGFSWWGSQERGRGK